MPEVKKKIQPRRRRTPRINPAPPRPGASLLSQEATNAAAWIARATGIQFMQWASPAQLLAHFWGQAISTPNPDADIRSLEEAGAFYIAEDGTPVQLKAEEALNAMIAAKVWGFTEDPEHSDPATIHYFRTSDATAERLFLFAVHEGSHAVIEPLIETFGPALDGELLAEVVSAVAARARRFAYGPVGNPAKEG